MTDKRVVVITGGTGNLGLALTRKYTDMGDAVVMADVDEKFGKTCETKLRTEGRNVTFIRVDITRESECAALIEKTVEKYGRLDVLCNNAGRISHYNDFLEMPLSDFNAVLSVNLTGAFLLTKFAAKKMLELKTKNGVIINTGSTSGFMPDENSLAYTVSKAGLHSLTKCTARELANKGIRVVAVAPAYIKGLMKGGSTDPSLYPELCELLMSNRVIEPQQVADVSYFLSTPESSGINGTIVSVDDGYTSFKMHTMLL